MSAPTRRAFLTAAPAIAVAAVVPNPPAPAPTPEPSSPFPWDTPAWAAAATSPAMDDLRLLAGLLNTAVNLMRAIEGDHPAGCPCPFCGFYSHRSLMGDLPFLAWGIDRAAAEVDGEITYHLPLDGTTFAADLHALAAFADTCR